MNVLQWVVFLFKAHPPTHAVVLLIMLKQKALNVNEKAKGKVYHMRNAIGREIELDYMWVVNGFPHILS